MKMTTSRKTADKTKVELVRLDNVSMDEDDEILPDFEAEVDDGRRVWVTAVLERTAVIEPAPGEPKVLVNRRRLFVNPRHLRVRHLASKEAARRGREAARQLSKRADFSVVNTAEAVGLHHAVPNAPNKRNEHDSFEVPNGKGRADDNQENRRKDEAPFEALE